MEYNLLDLIAALEEVVKKAAPFPIGKKSLVDCTEIDEIATEMRLVLPREIQQAQNIVADKNRIISDAKKEAEAIISKAEQQRRVLAHAFDLQQRRELIDQNSILQEARRRATEEISAAQQRSNLIRSSTQDYTDKMLSRVEELMVKDVNELRILRKTLSTGTELAKPQQPAQLPQGQPVPQQKK